MPSQARHLPAPSFYRMTIADFRRSAFLGKPPSANTIKAAIHDGTWAGEKVGGLYFIHVDGDCQPLPGTPAARAAASTGNSAADAIIIDYQAKKR